MINNMKYNKNSVGVEIMATTWGNIDSILTQSETNQVKNIVYCETVPEGTLPSGTVFIQITAV